MKPFQSRDKKTGELRYNGQWLIKFRAPDGTWRRQVGGGTAREAADTLADIEYKIRHGQWVDPRTVKVELSSDFRTWGDIVDKFKLEYSGRAKNSKVNLVQAIRVFSDGPLPLSTPIRALTPEKMIAVRDYLQGVHLSVSSKNLYIRLLKQIMKWATEDRPDIPLTENPAARFTRFVDMATDAAQSLKRDEVFTAADIEAMIREAFKDGPCCLAYLFLTAIRTGARKGELCGLVWRHVDLERGQIAICANYNRRQTKSKKDRIVPMIGDLAHELRKWKQASPYSRDGDPVFPTPEGKIRTEHFEWCEYVRRLARDAGIERPGLKVTGHQTRHYFITQWLLQGLNETKLARIVGHRDTKLIHSTYSHFTDSDLADEAERFECKPVTKLVTTATVSEIRNDNVSHEAAR